MKISASIKSKLNQHEITVQTNDAVKEIQISPKDSGFGSSINGGELLLLSLATCFCNDVYREARKRNIYISNVEVIFNGEFGDEGEPGANFTYKTNIISNATESEIKELIKHTDKIAEIHNTLRKGIEITLTS
jgi:uncharacterized OsmC-like protein